MVAYDLNSIKSEESRVTVLLEDSRWKMESRPAVGDCGGPYFELYSSAVQNVDSQLNRKKIAFLSTEKVTSPSLEMTINPKLNHTNR